MHRIVVPWVAIAALSSALAQSSSSYRLEQHSLNSGGDPRNGIVLVAPSFRLSFDTIGDPLARAAWSSASYRLSAGFAAGMAPPGEVRGVAFLNKTTLGWSPEANAISYAVYRSLGDPFALTAGDCLARVFGAEAATDTAVPGPGGRYYYLVTSTNRLDEEGTAGFHSDGTEHPTPDPCP
jgi:hypothetical protein